MRLIQFTNHFFHIWAALGPCLNVGVFTQGAKWSPPGSSDALGAEKSGDHNSPSLCFPFPDLVILCIPLSLGQLETTQLTLRSWGVSTAQVPALLGYTFPGAGRWLFLPKSFSPHFSEPHKRCGLYPEVGNGGRAGMGRWHRSHL